MGDPERFRRDADERFAAAVDDIDGGNGVDGGEHTGAGDDPHGEFPAELAAVHALRRAGEQTTLDAAAKDRVLATVTERDAGPDTGRTPAPARPTSAVRARRKASVLAAATAAGVLAFGAVGIELSHDALPGDLLYDVKRATESVSLDLTFSADGKANRHMHIAEKRLAELGELAERHETDDDGRYRAALNHYDATVAHVSQQITTYATSRDGADLHTLGAFAKQHRDAVTDLQSDVPEAVATALDGSLGQLRDVEERAGDLLERMECTTITSGERDELGAQPDDGPCTATAVPDTSAITPRADTEPQQETDATPEAATITGSSTRQPAPVELSEPTPSATTDTPSAPSSQPSSPPPDAPSLDAVEPAPPTPPSALPGQLPTDFGRG